MKAKTERLAGRRLVRKKSGIPSTRCPITYQQLDRADFVNAIRALGAKPSGAEAQSITALSGTAEAVPFPRPAFDAKFSGRARRGKPRLYMDSWFSRGLT
jgi:hypothetical protein